MDVSPNVSKPSVNAGSSIDYGNQIIPKLNVTGLTQTDVTNSFGTPEEVTLYFDDSANADTYYIYILKNGETAPDFSDSNNPPAGYASELLIDCVLFVPRPDLIVEDDN